MSALSPGARSTGSLSPHPSLLDMTFHELHLTCRTSFGGWDGVVGDVALSPLPAASSTSACQIILPRIINAVPSTDGDEMSLTSSEDDAAVRSGAPRGDDRGGGPPTGFATPLVHHRLGEHRQLHRRRSRLAVERRRGYHLVEQDRAIARQHGQGVAARMPGEVAVGPLARPGPAQQLSALARRPDVDVALAQARDVLIAQLDGHDRLPVAGGEARPSVRICDEGRHTQR